MINKALIVLLIVIGINSVVINIRLHQIEQIPPSTVDCRKDPCNQAILRLLEKLQDNIDATGTIAISNLLKINQYIYETTGNKGWFELK